MKSKFSQTQRRRERTRRRIAQSAYGRPRLSVFRSSKQIYVQLIDDSKGITLAAASSLEKENRLSLKDMSPIERARSVGRLVAQRIQTLGHPLEVVFDRGSYPYHGRVKALAEGAREAGLLF